MPKSRILDAAERLRIVGSTLNNPDDVAVARQYVEELEELAAWEVTTCCVVRSAGPEEERAAILSSSLKRAFPVNLKARFSGILYRLDREGHGTA